MPLDCPASIMNDGTGLQISLDPPDEPTVQPLTASTRRNRPAIRAIAADALAPGHQDLFGLPETAGRSKDRRSASWPPVETPGQYGSTTRQNLLGGTSRADRRFPAPRACCQMNVHPTSVYRSDSDPPRYATLETNIRTLDPRLGRQQHGCLCGRFSWLWVPACLAAVTTPSWCACKRHHRSSWGRKNSGWPWRLVRALFSLILLLIFAPPAGVLANPVDPGLEVGRPRYESNGIKRPQEPTKLHELTAMELSRKRVASDKLGPRHHPVQPGARETRYESNGVRHAPELTKSHKLAATEHPRKHLASDKLGRKEFAMHSGYEIQLCPVV